MKEVAPSAITWNARAGGFLFSASGKTVADRKTGIDLSEGDGDFEEATYEQVVDAMNLIYKTKKARKLTWQEAEAEFDKLVDDDQVEERSE